MPTLAHRIAALTAAILISLTTVLFVGAGAALADPYDDGDATVDVEPDYGGSAPEYGPEPDMGSEPDAGSAPETQATAPEPQEAPDAGGAGEPEPGPAEGGTGPGESEPAGGADEGPAAGGTEPGGTESGGTEPGGTEPGGTSGSEGTGGGSATEGGSGSGADGADDPSLDSLTDVTAADVAEADGTDVTTAESATAIAVSSTDVASQTTVDTMLSTIQTEYLSSSTATITQWNSAWVQYDQWYQPVFVNPYRVPIQLAYTYAGQPYVVSVPPLQRAVVNAPRPGVYSFTALVPKDSGGGVSSVSVGSFSGGGYVPRPGQPPPPKPAVPTTYQNVVVRFDFGNDKYKPVLIKSVTDLGNDPQVGAHKVLLDEETPAWGTWGTTKSGQRELTVKLTEKLPGLSEPAAEAPPGYQLVAAESPAAPQQDQKSVLPWVGLGLGIVAVVAVILVIVIGRRKRTTT